VKANSPSLIRRRMSRLWQLPVSPCDAMIAIQAQS
jgi:hypothetical protein